MKKLVLGVALAAMLALPLNAMASYYTLSVAQIQSIVEQPGITIDDLTGDSYVTSTTYTSYGAKFSGVIRLNNAGFGYETLGLDLGGVDLSAYDGFGLCLENVNENPWDLAVYAVDGSASEYVQTWITDVPTFSPLCITTDWASNAFFDATDVHEIGFQVLGYVPKGLAGDDYVYEVRVAPLPEPGTLALFGFGLAGAAASYRRKFAKKA